jgi:hypothetical protein
VSFLVFQCSSEKCYKNLHPYSLSHPLTRGHSDIRFLPSISTLPACRYHTDITSSSPESSIAPFLTALQERVKNDGIRIGSYPIFGRGVCVSLIGLDKPSILALGGEVIKETGGYIITEKELDEMRQA